MLHRPLNAFGDALGTTVAATIQTFDTHQRGIGSHTRLGSARAITANCTRAMRAMTHIIYGVVVVVIHIVAVIRKVRATIPKVVGQVDVMVVDARVDDSHHNTFTRIAQFPNLVGMDLDDILRDFAGGHCRSGFFTIGNPVVFLGKTHDLDVVAIRQILNGRLGGIEIQGICHP